MIKEVVKHEEQYTVRHRHKVYHAVVDKMGMFAGFISEVVNEDIPVIDKIVVAYRDGKARDVHRRRSTQYNYDNDRTTTMIKNIKAKARTLRVKVYGVPIREQTVSRNKAVEKRVAETMRTYKKKLQKGEDI